MYYVTKTAYVGPNKFQDDCADIDYIQISTSPATTNSSGEICLNGWCGTTNDFSVHAHGEYATLEEARSAIAEMFGDVRDSDGVNDRFASCCEEGVIEIYKPGRYIPMGREATANWAYVSIKADIKADTTDDRILELIDEYEADANDIGYTLGGDLEDFMRKRRQELREEIEKV